jgi:hypothetical protein
MIPSTSNTASYAIKADCRPSPSIVSSSSVEIAGLNRNEDLAVMISDDLHNQFICANDERAFPIVNMAPWRPDARMEDLRQAVAAKPATKSWIVITTVVDQGAMFAVPAQWGAVVAEVALSLAPARRLNAIFIAADPPVADCSELQHLINLAVTLGGLPAVTGQALLYRPRPVAMR